MYLHVCPVCEHRNARGSRFCNECGAPLQLRFCPACHAAADVLDLKCLACGATLPQVALSEAVDLPPEFAKAVEQPPVAPAIDRGETERQANASASDQREAPASIDTPARDPVEPTAKREPRVTAHEAPAHPLEPLTGPPFVSPGAHGPADEAAARFAAAKTASIIERLYGKSERPDVEPPPKWMAEPQERAAWQKPSAAVSGALMLLGIVLIGLFFVATEPSVDPGATLPGVARTPEAPVEANAVSTTVPPATEQSGREAAPQRTFGGTIRGLTPAPAIDSSASPPADGIDARRGDERRRAIAGARQHDGSGCAVHGGRPGASDGACGANVASASGDVGLADDSSAGTQHRFSAPAQASPCTPEVAALGLCTPTQ